MTSSNRVRITGVLENTPGTTPNTPRMRTARWTGESLNMRTPTYIDGDEVNSDRMQEDPTQVFKDVNGGLNVNVYYPVDLSLSSVLWQSKMMNDWANSPSRDNDGTADSVITNVTASSGVIAVTTGAAFIAGQLVQLSGFTNSGNNRIAKITTGSATVPAVGAGILTDEAAPPAAARMKVVGFVGASGDISATSTGLASSVLDFTTFTDLFVGKSLKIGGSAAGDRFATDALNTFVVISAIAAHAITLSNLPTGWTTDDGSGKTIKVWYPDSIKNGTTQRTATIEKGFLGQAVPNYHVGKGMQVDTYTETWNMKGKVKGVYAFKGMGGSKSTTSLDSSPDAAPTARNFASNVNAGRLSEGGSPLAGPNFCQSLEWTISNGLQSDEDITQDSPVGNTEGDCEITVKMSTYYGDSTLIDKFFNSTPTSLFSYLVKDGQAFTRFFPRLTNTADGNPVASGRNTKVMLPLTAKASRDTATGAVLIADRYEYVEI